MNEEWMKKVETAFAKAKERHLSLELRIGKLEKAATGDVDIEPADDDTLDGPHGDIEMRKDPGRWVGVSYAGKKMSQCPIPYLREYIDLKKWQLGKEAEQGQINGKKAGYVKKDMALALGWIRRIESGWKPQMAPAVTGVVDPGMAFADEDDDLRF